MHRSSVQHKSISVSAPHRLRAMSIWIEMRVDVVIVRDTLSTRPMALRARAINRLCADQNAIILIIISPCLMHTCVHIPHKRLMFAALRCAHSLRRSIEHCSERYGDGFAGGLERWRVALRCWLMMAMVVMDINVNQTRSPQRAQESTSRRVFLLSLHRRSRGPETNTQEVTTTNYNSYEVVYILWWQQICLRATYYTWSLSS